MNARRRDIDSAPPTAGLIEISRVLEETARIVRRHADVQAQPLRPDRPAGEPLPITVPLIRAILRIRRLHAGFLPAAAGDPAWTMVLELYAAQLERRPIHQAHLIRATDIPHTTGLRIAQDLLASGVFVSRPDPATAAACSVTCRTTRPRRCAPISASRRRRSPALPDRRPRGGRVVQNEHLLWTIPAFA
jgi:hypothetical protein